MKILFHEKAFDEYLYWQKNDKKTLKRLNNIIKDIRRNPYEGLGKPEPLKYELAGKWSRRISVEHRLVYSVNDDIIEVHIFSMRFHYSKK